MSIIKGIIKWILPIGIFALLRKSYLSFKRRNRYVNYGVENKDKTFYVVSCDQGGTGLFSIVLRNLSHISYALDMDYIPIIDLKNYPCQYLREGMLHKENAWEYYFEQPSGYTVEMIQKSKNIILSSQPFPEFPHKLSGNEVFWDSQALHYWKKLYKKYIRFNKRTQDYILDAYNATLSNKGKVLGVACRGTDILVKQLSNHPVLPDPMDVVNRAKQVMREQACDYLFLATEDEDIYTLFVQHFSSKLLSLDQKRVKGSDMEKFNWLYELNDSLSLDRYLGGLEYLAAIYLLSRCNCLIAGATGGSLGAILMTEGFDYEYIWRLGIYK